MAKRVSSGQKLLELVPYYEGVFSCATFHSATEYISESVKLGQCVWERTASASNTPNLNKMKHAGIAHGTTVGPGVGRVAAFENKIILAGHFGA